MKKHDFEALMSSRADSSVDRDKLHRYPECTRAWCQHAEQCGTARCCLDSKYAQEKEDAAIRL